MHRMTVEIKFLESGDIEGGPYQWTGYHVGDDYIELDGMFDMDDLKALIAHMERFLQCQSL